MKQLVNASLRVKLILAFLVVSLLPLTLLTLWKRQQTRQVLLDRVQQSLLNNTQQTAVVLEQFVTQNLNIVRVKAQLPSVANYLRVPVSERADLQTEVEETFETLIRRDILNIASYALLDRQGTIVWDMHPSNVGRSDRDRGYFQKPFQTGFPAVSDVIYSDRESEPILYFSAPVRDRAGEIIGVLLLRYRASVLQQIIGRSHPEDFAILLDRDGLRLAQNDAPDLVLQPIAPLSPAKFAALKRSGRVLPALRQEEVVKIPALSQNLQNRGNSPFFTFIDRQAVQQAVVVSLPHTRWSLVVAQRQAAFLAPIQAQLRNTILLGLLSAVLVSLAAIALSYRLTRPISTLMVAVRRFAAGDLAARSPVAGQDELGKLAASFNLMAEQIGQLLSNLEHRSQELELSQSMTVAIGELGTAIFERDRLLQDATHLILEQFRLEIARVYLWEEERQRLVLQHETTRSVLTPPSSNAIDIPQWVTAAATTQHPCNSQNAIAATAIPMVFNQTLMGVLELQDPQRESFSEIEQETFRTLANQIAIAWGNARLIGYIQRAKERSHRQAETLEQTLQELQETQGQLIQSEKMSSLGQLVAGVAHEINNPVSFISGNLVPLEDYIQSLLAVFQAYQDHYPNPPATLVEVLEAEDIAFIVADFPKLMHSMQVGVGRIKAIVKSLRTFSRLDEAAYKTVDLQDGLESTLLILQHRLKASPDRPEIEILKDYQPLPQIDCLPGQLNQVFMNILANAIDALEEHYPTDRTGTIAVSTAFLEATQQVQVTIEDNGPGIAADIKSRIFDPFFTTKAIGKGTGLGMSISYQIIAEKHGGQLECKSEPGRTCFTILLPIRQAPAIAEV